MTSTTIKAVAAGVLIVLGAIEFILREGALGIAAVIFGLALLGMVFEDLMSGPDSRRRQPPDNGPDISR
jgi:hypothetical protein